MYKLFSLIFLILVKDCNQNLIHDSQNIDSIQVIDTYEINCFTCSFALNNHNIEWNEPAWLPNACHNSDELWLLYYLAICSERSQCFDVCLDNFCVDPSKVTYNCYSCSSSFEEYFNCKFE